MMKTFASVTALLAVFASAAFAGEAPPLRCTGAISSCFKIPGVLGLQTNAGFVLDIEGSRSLVMSRHPPPQAISEIIGLDLSATIAGVYNVCPMRHDTNQLGHRHIFCIETFENLVVNPSGSAKPALCQKYSCKK
jgi:hypothetical protein